MEDSLKFFSEEVDAWIEENCPESMRTPMPVSEQVWASSNIQFPSDDAKRWFHSMVKKGWCTPEWPSEYGGGGLNFDEAKILKQRLRFFGCRPAQINFGISMLGPVLLEFGTEEQKQEFLPKISEAKSGGAKDSLSQEQDLIWQIFQPQLPYLMEPTLLKDLKFGRLRQTKQIGCIA